MGKVTKSRKGCWGKEVSLLTKTLPGIWNKHLVSVQAEWALRSFHLLYGRLLVPCPYPPPFDIQDILPATTENGVSST